jgi:NAD(P)-dependent dehydrogenase (short-subunit alcohol dehydrogenase family)
MAGRLAGQVALVTGAGSGIGRAIAEALAREGSAVAAAGRTPATLAATVSAIEAAGGRGLAVRCDVAVRESVEEAVAETVAALGPVDVLVANAGVCEAIGLPWEVDPEAWWRDVEVSLRGAFLCARTVLPSMIERGHGVVVAVSSYAATRADPNVSGYAAGKAALAQLSESLAVAAAPYGVEVFAAAPGTVRTPMTARFVESEEGRRWLGKFQTMRDEDYLPAERCAELVVRLASGEGRGLSGRFLHALDDLDELRSRLDEIAANELYALRLRRLR